MCPSVCSLTVDFKVDRFLQFSIQVVKISGFAFVYTRVRALGRFQHEKTSLTGNPVSLQMEAHKMLVRDRETKRERERV